MFLVQFLCYLTLNGGIDVMKLVGDSVMCPTHVLFELNTCIINKITLRGYVTGIEQLFFYAKSLCLSHFLPHPGHLTPSPINFLTQRTPIQSQRT